MFGSLKHSLLAAVVVFGSAQGSQGDKANLDKDASSSREAGR